MAKQVRSWNPGDAANAFVRMLLSEVGRLAGGIDEEQWAFTREYFEGRCAYTGRPLAEAEAVREHAVPINREHCGVHAFGNVLPACRAANEEKGRRHYREYMAEVAGGAERLSRIERFVEESGYPDRVAPFGDLRGYCELQYRQVVALAEAGRAHLRGIAGPAEEADAGGAEAGSAPPAPRRERGTLPIRLDPPGSAFRERLVAAGEAWVTTYYYDGRVEPRHWDASRMTLRSNVVANLRSRPAHRNPRWRELGIAKVVVTVDPVFASTPDAAHRARGFLDVPAEFGGRLGGAGRAELLLGDGSRIAARIERDADGGGAARVVGGAKLRDWLRHCAAGGRVLVRLRSPDRIEVGPA